MLSPYLRYPPRTLEQVHTELVAAYDALAMTDARRGPLACQIRTVEAAIDDEREARHAG